MQKWLLLSLLEHPRLIYVRARVLDRDSSLRKTPERLGVNNTTMIAIIVQDKDTSSLRRLFVHKHSRHMSGAQ